MSSCLIHWSKFITWPTCSPAHTQPAQAASAKPHEALHWVTSVLSPQNSASGRCPQKKSHWLLELQLPRVCGWLLILGVFAKGPNPHIKLHVINISILVVHKLLKLSISQTGLIPTSFPWKDSFYFLHDNLCHLSSKKTVRPTLCLFHPPSPTTACSVNFTS